SEYVEEFGIAVALSESVSHLNMCGNNIAEHAELFGIAIASSESITHLNVSGNNMGRYAVAFGGAISNSKSITNLVMDCNNIGEYAEEFGWCVARSTALKSLYMYDNNIFNAEVFGNAIASSRALIHLYLFNIVTPQDAKSFGRSIAHAASLKFIEGIQDLFLEAQACQNAEQCAIQSQLIYFLPLPVSSIVVEYLGNLLDVFDAEGS
ncbi:protein phosphatase 1 regulatory subunit 42, partial [Rickettsiaceae bacterium]|nr:protein phosphatase 1 regulatory subunit 42 [Rickettsiaceae bacterium]